MRAARVQLHEGEQSEENLREAVLTGFAAKPKRIPPKFFYDQRGSELFEAICELPEYYLTRTEMAILQRHGADIARSIGPRCLVVELGSGASKKIRLLLEILRPAAYLGIDISRKFLLQSTQRLARDYPWLEVHATSVDFGRPLHLSWYPDTLPKLVFFPGSSIGNLEPHEAMTFLKGLQLLLQPRGALLIGVDLKKDPKILDAAYNDAQGVTAAFNLNLLHRIRRELDADLLPETFRHLAFYNETAGRIEMHLVSLRRQRIRIEQRHFQFVPGERLHTESSYKYSVAEFQSIAEQAGYRSTQVWTDPGNLFSVHFLSSALK